MVLIFMNLLIGLTVSSIDELKRAGTIMQAEKRVDDILLLSKTLPKKCWPDNLMSTKFNLKSKKVCFVHLTLTPQGVHGVSKGCPQCYHGVSMECSQFRIFLSCENRVLPHHCTKVSICIFQVCIRVTEEKYYRFDPLHVYDTHHELYWYNEIDCKHGSKITGLTLPSKIIRHALEAVKDINVILSNLQEKESNIKEESEKRYKKFIEGIEHHPSSASGSGGFSKFSDGVSNESLKLMKRVQSELTKQIKDFQDAERERFSKMEETLQIIQDSLQKQT